MLNILTQIGQDALECNLLVGMKNELEARGWCKFRMFDSATDRVCIIGSANKYLNFSDNLNYMKSWLIIANLVNIILLPYTNLPYHKDRIPGWNDSKNRTYEDVINLLDKAIADRGGFV